MDRLDKTTSDSHEVREGEETPYFEREVPRRPKQQSRMLLSIIFAFISVFFVTGFSIYTVITVDTTLPITIKLVYSLDNVAIEHIKKGESFSLPLEPSKLGYTFEGWFSDSEYKTEFDFSKSIKSNTTLYAKWTKNSYKVIFRLNTYDSALTLNFANSVFNQTYDVPFGENFVIPNNSTGLGSSTYTFVKWERRDNTGAVVGYYELGKSFLMPPEDVVLFAVWA